MQRLIDTFAVAAEESVRMSGHNSLIHYFISQLSWLRAAHLTLDGLLQLWRICSNGHLREGKGVPSHSQFHLLFQAVHSFCFLSQHC